MRTVSTLLPFLLLGTQLTFGQNQVDQVDTVDRNQLENPRAKSDKIQGLVPTIYDGELEDIGPQYLLLQKPPRYWVELLADAQVYSTNNAGLLENNPEGTDILAVTLQAALIPYKTTIWGGALKTRVGYRDQFFYYGELSGKDQTVNGATASSLDFNNRQPFADVSFLRGPLSVRLGIQYSELRNRQSSDRFYTETVPTWSVGYDFELNQKSLLTLNYNGNYRATDSQSFGLLPDDWNDKTEHSFSATYSYLLSEQWLVQTNAGFEYAYYTHNARDREDITGFANVTLAYFFTPNLSARLFSSYEKRESTEGNAEDYSSFNLGGGVALNWSL